MRLTFLLALATGLTMGCGGKHPGKYETLVSENANSNEATNLIAEGDALFEERADLAKLEASIAKYKAAVAAAKAAHGIGEANAAKIRAVSPPAPPADVASLKAAHDALAARVAALEAKP